MDLPYNPILSVDKCDQELRKLKKLNYNRFMWWRSYTYQNSLLSPKSSFRDRILNGDFDPSCYKIQVWKCEHDMNEIYKECHPDISKYLEQTSLTRTRRKRLLEDFEKDENGRLSSLFTEFSKNFNITKEQIFEEIDKCLGDLTDFYYLIEDKYQKYNIITSKKSKSKKL